MISYWFQFIEKCIIFIASFTVLVIVVFVRKKRKFREWFFIATPLAFLIHATFGMYLDGKIVYLIHTKGQRFQFPELVPFQAVDDIFNLLGNWYFIA